MGCQWSRLDEVVTDVDRPSPSPNHTAKPIVETGKSLNKKRQSKLNKSQVTPTQRTSIKESFRQLGQRDKGLSPLYNKLPKKAKKYSVKSVYDGDTLTLSNHKRVRFLGIDTPELKNPTQAFSEEAKAYTLKRCGDQPIWISFEEGYDTEDRYGRLLCWVWIQSGQKYECVNEGLLNVGLAAVYTPSKGAKLHNMSKLIAMQKEAREKGRGMWRSFRDFEVVTTMHGTAFHHPNRKCEHLQRSKNLTTLMSSVAMDKGRHPCTTCLGDE